jgi:hypothetical protein
MIYKFKTIEQAQAIADPKLIWINVGEFVVFTNDDLLPLAKIIQTNDFRSRFTDAETDAILNLAYSGDAIARRILLKLQTVGEIDLSSQSVIDGMSYWVSKKIMTQKRADEILA